MDVRDVKTEVGHRFDGCQAGFVLVKRLSERPFRHQQSRREMIRFEFERVGGDEACPRDMDTVLQDLIDVSGQEVVAQFVANAEFAGSLCWECA